MSAEKQFIRLEVYPECVTCPLAGAATNAATVATRGEFQKLYIVCSKYNTNWQWGGSKKGIRMATLAIDNKKIVYEKKDDVTDRCPGYNNASE